MWKRRLWMTGQILRDCWNEACYYITRDSEEAFEKVVLNLKIIDLCREYILR